MCPQVDCCPLSVGLQTVLWHGWLGGSVGTRPGSSESQCVQMFRKLALNNVRLLSTGLSPVFSPVLCTWKLKVVVCVLVLMLVDGEQAAQICQVHTDAANESEVQQVKDSANIWRHMAGGWTRAVEAAVDFVAGLVLQPACQPLS